MKMENKKKQSEYGNKSINDLRLSDEYVIDYDLYDKDSWNRIWSWKKAPAKKAIYKLIEFLDKK